MVRIHWFKVARSLHMFQHMKGHRRDVGVKGHVDYTLDVRGMISPFSLLKASLMFQRMETSQVLEILGGDRDMSRDLVRILPEASCEVVFLDPLDQEPENSVIRLKKKI